MRYLVTGAAGFIGSHITDRLLAEGHTVTGIDNFETGQARNIHDSAKVIRADIADRKELWNAFRLSEPDVVFHCAASYKNPRAWQRDVLTNALGSSLVAEMAAEHGSRIVYFQTALCYGSKASPTRELFAAGPVPVHAPLAPDSSYAISKTAGESYIVHSGVPYVSFRLANIYGPRNLSGPIPTFARNIMGGRKSVVVDTRRDFVFVEDLLKLVWAVLNTDYTGIVHAASGHDYPIAQLYGSVEIALGSTGLMESIPRAPDDAPSILLDPEDTARAFGWRATTPLNEGIAKAVEWYRANPVGDTYTHLAIPAAA